MRKFLGVAVATLALVSASSASAQTFATTPGTYTFDGFNVQVKKGDGPQLSCYLSIDIVRNSSGGITATNPVLTGSLGFCDTVVFQGAPWTVTNPSPNVWRVNGIYVDTTITDGDCQGYLDATFIGTGPERLSLNTGFVTPPPSTLPQVTTGGPCKISGVIDWP